MGTIGGERTPALEDAGRLLPLDGGRREEGREAGRISPDFAIDINFIAWRRWSSRTKEGMHEPYIHVSFESLALLAPSYHLPRKIPQCLDCHHGLYQRVSISSITEWLTDR